jgi:hypothetical protein
MMQLLRKRGSTKCFILFALTVMRLCMPNSPGLAGEIPKREALSEVVLDIDRDGKLDKAVAVLNDAQRAGSRQGGRELYWQEGSYELDSDESVDLFIYLGFGNQKTDLSVEPSFAKRGIVSSETIEPLEVNARGSLVVKRSWHRGLGNDSEDRISITYRDGAFIVAGFSRTWEIHGRSIDNEPDAGSCDINYLSGVGAFAAEASNEKLLWKKFEPIKLANWSDDEIPRACQHGR